MSPLDLHADFHIHSTFSDDARSTLAENLAAAQERGLRTVRLLEHVRRSTDWLPRFAAAVATQRPAAGLTVRTGVEAKILDASGTIDAPEQLCGIETVVVADHRFPGPDRPWSPAETRERLASGLSVREALDLLVDGLVGAMENVGPVHRATAQLAHCFSILPKVGLSEDDLDEEHLYRWAEAAARTATLVEVNEKWACPGPRALGAALAAGAVLVAATDSHHADEVGRYTRVPELVGGIGRVRA